MAKIEVCRTCLTETVKKDVTQLSEELKAEKKSYWDIMLFCLNIEVLQESKLTTKLCERCFIKIISFHEFKTLALKNDAYLRCIQRKDDKKFDIFDVDNIKCEEYSDGHSDEYDTLCDTTLDKTELELKNERSIDDVPSDDEFLSVIKKIKDEYEGETCKENKKSNMKTIGKTQKVKVRKKRVKKGKEPAQQEKVCEECGKTVVNLLEHMKMHLPAEERKRVKCKVCDKTFASYGARYRHNKIKHLGIKQHCEECGKDVVNLRSHRLVMHSYSNLPFECVPCGRRFITKSRRDQHMIKHTKDRPYACNMCDKDFQHNIGLLQHKRRIHDKEKTHLCQVCSKRFFSKYALKIHLRGHSKEKPVECPDCGKGFSSTTIMKSHQLIHSDIKNFACALCGMAFKKPGYLRVHMISHTKVKPYSCSYCDMPFGRSDHKARHERTAHQRPLTTQTLRNCVETQFI